MQNKVVIPGKVDKLSNKKFKVKRDKTSEKNAEIDIEEAGDFEVDKLSTDGLPSEMTDGNPIRWFNNFAIKKNGQYISQRYFVNITGLSSLGDSRVVIFASSGNPYYYVGKVIDDTIELTDGDPAVGAAP